MEIDIPCEDYIIHVGRFEQVKRHDRLFKIFSKANLPCKLVLIGSGSTKMQNKIQEMICEFGLGAKVILLGFQKNPYPYMKNAKLCILTSDYEGLPTVICESLICGTPVVSTDCPSGPREILIYKCARGLVPLDDIEAFVNTLKAVYYQPYDIDEKVIERFSIKNTVQKYLALVSEC